MFFVPWQVVYKYCDKSFINKHTFFNFVPQLVKKTYCTSTTWFYRFACMIVVQAHFFNGKTELLCVLLWCETFRYFSGFQSCFFWFVIYYCKVFEEWYVFSKCWKYHYAKQQGKILALYSKWVSCTTLKLRSLTINPNFGKRTIPLIPYS